MFLKAELKRHFKDADIKYIDPSYIIRCETRGRARGAGVLPSYLPVLEELRRSCGALAMAHERPLAA